MVPKKVWIEVVKVKRIIRLKYISGEGLISSDPCMKKNLAIVNQIKERITNGTN